MYDLTKGQKNSVQIKWPSIFLFRSARLKFATWKTFAVVVDIVSLFDFFPICFFFFFCISYFYFCVCRSISVPVSFFLIHFSPWADSFLVFQIELKCNQHLWPENKLLPAESVDILLSTRWPGWWRDHCIILTTFWLIKSLKREEVLRLIFGMGENSCKGTYMIMSDSWFAFRGSW